MYSMKHLGVAEARAQFGEVLDLAEKGQPVVIVRRGVRFKVTVDADPRPKAAAPLFAHVDEAIAGGQWTWTMGARGLTFAESRKRK